MSNTLIGILIKILSVAFVVLLAVLIKSYPDDAPVTELMFFRSLLSLPFVVLMLAIREKWAIKSIKYYLTPNNPWLHLRRSLLGMMTMGLTFTSVTLIPLPIANALKEFAPVIITILAVMFLGEKIRIYRTIGLILGVIGVAIITYQTVFGEVAQTLGMQSILGATAAIGSAFCLAVTQIQIRSMVANEHPTAVVFYFLLFTSLVCLLFSPFGWVWPSPKGWLWLIAIGLCGAISQLALTYAYKFANASTIAPFEYFSIPFAIFLGGFLFDEWPKPLSLLGVLLILCGGVIIIIREGQAMRKQKQQTPPKSP